MLRLLFKVIWWLVKLPFKLVLCFFGIVPKNTRNEFLPTDKEREYARQMQAWHDNKARERRAAEEAQKREYAQKAAWYEREYYRQRSIDPNSRACHDAEYQMNYFRRLSR